MKELYILLAPVFWSVKNDIVRFNWSFYKKIIFYIASGSFFIFLITKLLGIGITKLQNLSPEAFNLLFIKGYSLIFVIIFFIQIINGLLISLSTYYQSKDLEVLFTSPVNRTSLFFSRLFETHIKASWMLVIFGIPLLVASGLLYHASIFYYLYALILFIVFSTIPVNVGTAITIFLSSVFHIRRLKKFLLSTGGIGIVLLVMLLRIFKPERFVNPELFANLTLFISETKTPSFILLPTRWLSESIFDFLNKTINSNTIIFISLLFLTSYVTTAFIQVVFRRYHYGGWGILQEGAISLKGRKPYAYQTTPSAEGLTIAKSAGFLAKILDAPSRVFLKKDFLYQLRDVKTIHQILILLALIIVYLFSISSLPMNWEYYAVQIKYLVSFFNLGLILIIIASLCSRIVYSAVVSEGTALWIMRTSPMTPKRYIWIKFLFFFIPIFLLGQLLILCSSFLIGIEKEVILLEVITTAFLSFSLVGMAIAFAVSSLRYEGASILREEIRAGSTAYMLTSVFFILFTLALEIIPIFLYFLREAKGAAFTQKAWIIIGIVMGLLSLVNLIVTAFSMKLSIKRMDNLQIS